MTDLAMDYLGLDALLSAEELAWRDTVRAFVRDRIRPNIKEWYEKAVFPVGIVAEMGRLGLLGTHLSGYGCPGRSAVEYGLAAMELEAGDSGLRTFVSVQGSLAMSAIDKFGAEAQKQRWLPGMAAGELIGCFGLTEPEAGSDPAGMTTTARRDGGGWVINGAKRWIGLASIADITVIWARTEDGIRGFLVPADTRGFTATAIEPKLAMRASIQCDITLADVRVPADAILPGAAGLRGPFSCLNEARYGIIWGAMGAARDAYEAALAYALDRRQFGKPIASFQLTQQKLVVMVLEIQKGLLVALHIGRMKDAGTLRPEQISFGKLNNVRTAIAIARQARTILGGNGVAMDYSPIRQQPRGRTHLRGHRRGAHPDHGPGHHRHPRLQLKDSHHPCHSGHASVASLTRYTRVSPEPSPAGKPAATPPPPPLTSGRPTVPLPDLRKRLRWRLVVRDCSSLTNRPIRAALGCHRVWSRIGRCRGCLMAGGRWVLGWRRPGPGLVRAPAAGCFR
jgi:glutaryl-CoA dehydrogenase